MDRTPLFGRLALLCGMLLAFAGCGRAPAPEDVVRLSLVGEKVRAGELGKPLMDEVRVLALDARGRRVPGVRVRFRLHAANGDPAAGVEAVREETDAGGMAGAVVYCGEELGGYEIVAEAVGAPREVAPARCYVVAGMTVRGGGQDVSAGDFLERPIEVRLERRVGEPAAGAHVEFDLRQGPPGTRLDRERAVADADGVVRLAVRAGGATGRGEIGIRLAHAGVATPEGMGDYRVAFFSIDGWAIVVQVVGGLAVFIFGMKLMSEGLALVAGDRMRNLLGLFTKSRFSGLLVGTGVTALIQSSSACTVMLVGFVNAGLMNLNQAIGVVFGANIGTTVTAQLVSLRLDRLALPAVAFGVAAMVLARKRRSKRIAQIFVGFGLLFYGMGMMSGTLRGLNESQMISGLFQTFDCTPVGGAVPWRAALMGVLVGTVVTVVVQSSSASMGLLLALVNAGVINAWSGFAFMLGDNIGTTITAILAASAAGRTSKQVACAHTLFNVMGALYMYALLFVSWNGQPVFLAFVNGITPGDAFAGENVARFVANAHTSFNVLNALLFLPFVGLLAAACRKVLPDKPSPLPESRELVRYLDPYLLATPAVALEQARKELAYMVVQARKSMSAGFEALVGPPEVDDGAVAYVQNREDRIDRIQEALLQYLGEIGGKDLTDQQAREMAALLQSVNDVERAGDHAVALVRLALRVHERGLAFSERATADMRKIYAAVEAMFGHATAMLERREAEANVGQLLDLEAQVNAMRTAFRRDHLARIESSGEDVRCGVVLLEMLTHMERIGDHLVNLTAVDAEASAMRPPDKD